MNLALTIFLAFFIIKMKFDRNTYHLHVAWNDKIAVPAFPMDRHLGSFASYECSVIESVHLTNQLDFYSSNGQRLIYLDFAFLILFSMPIIRCVNTLNTTQTPHFFLQIDKIKWFKFNFMGVGFGEIVFLCMFFHFLAMAVGR